MFVIIFRMGRPSKIKQPEYGLYLASLRKAVSLSQQQLADFLGVRQATLAAWEHSATPPKGEFLLPLSEILNVPVEELLTTGRKKTAKHRGPASRIESLMDKVATLPQRKQKRIANVIEALLTEEAKAS